MSFKKNKYGVAVNDSSQELQVYREQVARKKSNMTMEEHQRRITELETKVNVISEKIESLLRNLNV
jgi:hypothetical protein